MSHLLTILADGKAALAVRAKDGESWHRLDRAALPESASSAELLDASGAFDWQALRVPTEYTLPNGEHRVSQEHALIVHSELGHILGQVSERYREYQPEDFKADILAIADILEAPASTAGSLKNWSELFVSLECQTARRGIDGERLYVVARTGFDGETPTILTCTAIRPVCNNTIRAGAAEGKSRGILRVPHKRKIAPGELQAAIATSGWHEYIEGTERLAATTPESLGLEPMDFFCRIYLGRTLDEIEEARRFRDTVKEADLLCKQAEKLAIRMNTALYSAPGCDTAAAKGTLYGLLNAVTYDVDHQKPAHSDENRYYRSQFGTDADLKVSAFQQLIGALPERVQIPVMLPALA